MTKSTITREESVQAVFDLKVGYRLGFADLEILKRVASMALAAMDSKPDCNERQLFCSTDTARMKKVISVSAGSESTPLYRHAQPAPASEPVYQYWCYTTVENSEGDPEEFWFWKDCEKDFYDRWKNAKRTLYKTPQPALVVPPEQHWEELCRQQPDMSIGDAIIRAAWWNHCRAAMLQASPVCTCPSGDGSLHWPCPVHPGNSPAQSYCCPAQNSVSPAQNGIAPAQSPIDHGYRPECECSGCKATARICAELSVNSPANPDCWCRTCRPVVLNDMRFVVCPDCGNKRCPRANDHRNACTGSNEPGQEGSAYPDTTQEPKP